MILDEQKKGVWAVWKSYHRELLKGKLEAFCVICDSFCCDVLHGVLKKLLVPHIGLNQMVETCRFFHPGVELEKTEGEL